jgi:hypothetical protein
MKSAKTQSKPKLTETFYGNLIMARRALRRATNEARVEGRWQTKKKGVDWKTAALRELDASIKYIEAAYAILSKDDWQEDYFKIVT